MIFTPWQKFKMRKAQEANLEKRNSGPYATSALLGILYHNDDQAKIDAVEKLATLIKMDGKKVKIIAYEHRNSI